MLSKEETDELIMQINELRAALSRCWSLLPDGYYGVDGMAVKKAMTKYDCWPNKEPR